MSVTNKFTFDLLAHFSMAQTIFGAHEAGLWKPYQADPTTKLSPEHFSKEHGKHARYVRGICEYFVRRDLMQTDDEGKTFGLSKTGHELVTGDWLGYFVFLVGGYGNVLRNSGQLTNQTLKYGADVSRDGYYVALGSELNGRSPHHRSFEVVFEAAEQAKPTTILDLGSGSGAFLIDLFKRSGATRGIGIDINKESCELARRNIAAANLQDQITIYEGDARRVMEFAPEIRGSVDLVTGLFLIHEFLYRGHDDAIDKIKDLRAALRPDGEFLLLEKQTDILEAGEAPPYFTEFKLLHDLTDQDLCNQNTWCSILRDAGFVDVNARALKPHTGSVLLTSRNPSS